MARRLVRGLRDCPVPYFFAWKNFENNRKAWKDTKSVSRRRLLSFVAVAKNLKEADSL